MRTIINASKTRVNATPPAVAPGPEFDTKRFIYKEQTSTHAYGTDPRVDLGAEGELPWIDLGACRHSTGTGVRRDRSIPLGVYALGHR